MDVNIYPLSKHDKSTSPYHNKSWREINLDEFRCNVTASSSNPGFICRRHGLGRTVEELLVEGRRCSLPSARPSVSRRRAKPVCHCWGFCHGVSRPLHRLCGFPGAHPDGRVPGVDGPAAEVSRGHPGQVPRGPAGSGQRHLGE